MKRLQMRRLGFAVALALLVFAPLALAQGDYALPWWTVDCGGGFLTGDGYTLMGTLGQPDAGVLRNGAYVLRGGFWGGEAEEPTPATPTPGAPPDEPSPVFLPLVLKNW